MDDPVKKPGPPPALQVDIEIPTVPSPIDVETDNVHVEVRATGGDVNQVRAETYDPADPEPDPPSHVLDQDTIDLDLYVGDIPAPCSETSPYPEFKIKARGEFVNPSGDITDPPVEVDDVSVVFTGRCVGP